MKTSEILIKAKSLIDTPEKWTTETLARNSAKKPVGFDSEEAVCFCSLGALHRIFEDMGDENSALHFNKSKNYLRMGTQHQFIAHFNDDATHEEVMVAWDKAIELAKADEE